jgi:hypothetical protein
LIGSAAGQTGHAGQAATGAAGQLDGGEVAQPAAKAMATNDRSKRFMVDRGRTSMGAAAI